MPVLSGAHSAARYPGAFSIDWRSRAGIGGHSQTVGMSDSDRMDSIAIFLGCASVVHEAIADKAVAAAWDRPSVLEEQRVSNLCGHLARGTWVVGEYLDSRPPTGPPDFNSAAEYFSLLSDRATEEFHRANRQREANLVPAGHGELVTTLGGPPGRPRQDASIWCSRSVGCRVLGSRDPPRPLPGDQNR